MKISGVLSEFLQAKSSPLAPHPAWPGAVLGQVKLGSSGCLVGSGTIAQPVDHSKCTVCPDGSCTRLILIHTNSFRSRDESSQVLVSVVQCQKSGTLLLILEMLKSGVRLSLV